MLQKRYLKVLPEEGNVPEVNFANKFSKHQKFTLTPDYLFKRTLMLKSENWCLLGKHWICKDFPYKYYCNFPFLKKSETILSVWHNSSLGPKVSEKCLVLCQSLGLIMLTIHKLWRLVCPSRLKYWCYFRWVLGYEDYIWSVKRWT